MDAFNDRYFDKITYEFPPNKYVDLNASYYNDGIAYFSEFEGFKDDYEVVAAEDEFEEIIDDDFILHGFIDLLLRDKKTGDYIVWDHKSKASFKNNQEQHDYARQLYLYSLHIYRKYGKYPNYLIFNMFRKRKTTKITFKQRDFEEAISWMKNTVQHIRECKEYPPSPDQFFCQYLCNHRETCEYRDGSCQ